MSAQKLIWFKAKRYGYGWYPATWQGWLVILIYIVLITLDALRIDALSHSVSDTLINWIPDTALLTALLIAICYWKGEPPRWRWG